MTPRYRIIRTRAYNGCEPITAHMVQVREDTWCGTTWRDVKGFEDIRKAIELYNTLTSK